ncbi:hypothetical protein EDB81DRAFT_898685 [Dactylonectria macrodidyma]|uniref:DUF7791 domain-containing protein n=1 Tax=Dactylonectria macrodidyma TaxID=307937 RepID=A0A9P9FV38_9HYPO|nr:hypothetical protein EDB81DRAFT_898685 [Dactylonectria macrodidyma]
MAETLLIALCAKEPLDAAIYSFHDEDDDEHTGYATYLPDWGEETFQFRREQIFRRLNGRCRGLLEQNFLGQVEFLHRTVVDFLKTQEITEYLRAQSRENFNASLAIIKAYIAWIKSAGIEDGEFSIKRFTSGFNKGSIYHSMLARGIQKALRYAVTAEMDTSVNKVALDGAIDDMDHAISSLISSVSLNFLEHNLLEPGDKIEVLDINSLDSLFRETILDMPLLGYLSRKLPRSRVYFSGFDQPALFKALFPAFTCNIWPKLALQKLTCLLENGHDPNQLMLGSLSTVWQRFLSEIFPTQTANTFLKGPRFRAALMDGLIQVFLEYGADPNARFSIGSSKVFETLLSLSYQIFSTANEVKELQAAYLAVLNSFIRHGATFDCRNTEGHLIRYPALSYEDEDPVLLFFTQLKQTIEISASPDQANDLVDIAQRILPLARDAKLSLNHTQASLNAVLGSPTHKKNYNSFMKRVKREELDEVTPHKRLRQSTMENES